MYRELNAEKVLETSARLQKRVDERFPAAGLGKVVAELHVLAREAARRAKSIRRPHLLLRLVSTVLVLCILAGVGWFALNLEMARSLGGIELLGLVESGIGTIVFIGAAVVFLVTIETRHKRKRALSAIHELRSVAHIIDMHQLTKDPESVAAGASRTASSPERTLTPFQLSRYLDYCSEMLSIVSKIGAIYVQGFPDPGVVGAVDQIESLTTGLSRKIWQKVDVLNRTQQFGRMRKT